MRISIEYDSCWHMGFLADDDKKPIEKVNNKTNLHHEFGYMQKFVATSKTRGEKECHTTNSTILGVLCRLIGDQRKLYQARSSDNYYFADIEGIITFKSVKQETVSELVYLTNKSDDRCGQGNWLGVISDDNPWFNSPFAVQFWSILFLDRNELLKFILSKQSYMPAEAKNIVCKPTKLLYRLNQITDIKSDIGSPWLSSERLQLQREKIENKIKAIQEKVLSHQSKLEKSALKTEKQRLTYNNKSESLNLNLKELFGELEDLGSIEQSLINEIYLDKAVSLVIENYPNNEYWKDGTLYPYRLYAAALYIQAQRLMLNGANLQFMLNKKQELQIQGFSKRGFNGVRDWLNSMTGGRKKAVGTPCKIKKQSGQLEIELKLDPTSKGLYFKNMSRAEEIKRLIENAGVSSFYLGKKGLAYVSNIRI